MHLSDLTAAPFHGNLDVVTIPGDEKLIATSGRIALSNARLLIRAFHFFSVPSSQRNSGLLQTYFIACELIGTAVRLDREREWSSHCNQMQARAIGLAAVCILRVLRSNLRPQVDAQLGEEMFFETISISKKRSIRSNDLDARNAIILTQLWSSTRLFQYKDGSVDGLRLLLRGRLVSLPTTSFVAFANEASQVHERTF